ncbi:MAG: hypothetical protein HRU21_12565, partial [Pseudomonadales bacterium]|nr:hypothetical protein [Pseudomonadales bacterium]
MYRKLASAILLAGSVQANQLLALGLGEMTMLSAINEPLKAEIVINNVADLDATQILVDFASDQQFLDAGVERTFYLSNIKFVVEVLDDGSGLIKLSSFQRLNEPFLDFVIEAKWPTGRILRSYTALVDLPSYTQASASQLATPAVSSQPTQTSSKRTEADSSAPVTRQTQPQANRSYAQVSGRPNSDSEYNTEVGDSLWSIAKQYTPQGASIQQTMTAIYQDNPSAFIRGDINRLKAAALLSVPDASAIRSVDKMLANDTVYGGSRQVLAESEVAIDASSPVDAQSAVEEAIDAADTRGGELSLVATGDATTTGVDADGVASGANSAEMQALTNENANLTSQVDSLSSQVEQLERLLEIQEQKLAQLQNQFAAQNDAADISQASTAVAVEPEQDIEQQTAQDALLDNADLDQAVSAAGDEVTEEVETSAEMVSE